jgi:type II secretory pathway component PulM
MRRVARWSVIWSPAFSKSEKQHKILSRTEAKDSNVDLFALPAIIRLNLKVDEDLRQTPAFSAQRLETPAFLQRPIAASQLQFHIDRSSEIW